MSPIYGTAGYLFLLILGDFIPAGVNSLHHSPQVMNTDRKILHCSKLFPNVGIGEMRFLKVRLGQYREGEPIVWFELLLSSCPLMQKASSAPNTY
jgi:hypothetical protein